MQAIRLKMFSCSEMAKRTSTSHVAEVRSRLLDAGPYTFLAAGTLTMKVREGRTRGVSRTSRPAGRPRWT